MGCDTANEPACWIHWENVFVAIFHRRLFQKNHFFLTHKWQLERYLKMVLPTWNFGSIPDIVLTFIIWTKRYQVSDHPLMMKRGYICLYWPKTTKIALKLTLKGLKCPNRCELNIENVVLFVGHSYKPFGTMKIWPSWQGGSGKVKICPRMAWIWLWSRSEAPKLVSDPWNGPKMVPPTAPDWFESISLSFKALQPLYIKKTSIIL